MKILILFIIFYLISGPVHCSDVIGYSGGRVIINVKHINSISAVYFCKFKTQTECKDLIISQDRQTVHKDRFTLFDSDGLFTLIFRNLSLQDTGMYQSGGTGVWSEDINLKVKSDPCCSGTKTVRGYLGQTVMISCSYPVEFKTHIKSFYRLNRLSETELIRTNGREQHQEGRFSISDDSRNKVFSVNISDVREDDGGVYSCAVINEGTVISYHSLFTVIQLQVTDATNDTMKNPDGTSDTPEPGKNGTQISSAGSSHIITTTVCVCVTVLLMGGFLFIYKLRSNKTQDSASITQQKETNNMTADYENDPEIHNTAMHMVYQNRNPNTNQSDLVYQSLNPNTKQADAVYQSLNPNINQSDSVYQSLDRNTNQADSIYQILDPKSN